MTDVSDIIAVQDDKFSLTEKVSPGEAVNFNIGWKNGKEWYFEGNVADNGTTVNLTCIGS